MNEQHDRKTGSWPDGSGAVDVEVQTLKLVLPQRLLGDAILSQTEELLLVSLATGLGANRSKRGVSKNLGGCAKKLTRNVSHL